MTRVQRLGLGTVQFGLNYGIANKRGQVETDEVRSILTHARRSGLDTLDTAMAYGDSEERLGEAGVPEWRVVSKLGSIPAGCDDVAGWVSAAARGSCDRLKLGSLYGLLLHDPRQLLQPGGAELYGALTNVKDEGLVKKVGVSIYAPEELEELTTRFHLDLVQAPLNLLDQRLVRTGWLRRLAELGTEVHARSVFLQGLLLLRPAERPAPFARWRGIWQSYDQWLEKTNLTSLEACLRQVLSLEQVSRVIVGVDSLPQLKEILAAAEGPSSAVPLSIATDDTDLLHPSRWPAL